jgi:hypothetical protein
LGLFLTLDVLPVVFGVAVDVVVDADVVDGVGDFDTGVGVEEVTTTQHCVLSH